MSGITPPTADQEQRAKWDLLLSDLEYRAEQIRNIKAGTRLLPWQLALSGMTSGAALFAAGAAFWKLLGG